MAVRSWEIRGDMGRSGEIAHLREHVEVAIIAGGREDEHEEREEDWHPRGLH